MLKNLAISLIGVLISLLLLELVVRFILIPSSKSVKWDDRPGYYYRKKVSSSEDRGPGEKGKNTFRIAAVGDSITYGPYMQFDDVYAKRLERMYNLNGIERKLEVVNYGVSGYATSHEIEIVKKALRDKSDLLILQITLNDPELTPLDQQHENTVQRFGPFRPSPALKKIISYWKTLGFILTRLHNTRTHHEYKRYFTELFEKKESWDVFYDSLKTISQLAKNENVPMVAVIFPLFGQNIGPSYPFTEIHEKINKALEDLNIKHTDLLPFYSNIPASRLQVIPGVDFHPNEIGHRIAAEKIYKFLRKKKLVPEEFLIQNITNAR